MLKGIVLFLLGFALAASLAWANHQVPLTPGLRDFYQEDQDHQRQQNQDRLNQLEHNWLRQQLIRPSPC